jgi:Flp pilus assembly protein protease CpaA
MAISMVIFAIWSAASAIYDMRFRRVPNRLMVFGMLGALFVRLGSYEMNYWVVGAAWASALLFWRLGYWGGADAKFLMVLTLAFSDPFMVLWMMLIHLLVGVVGWICQRARREMEGGVQPTRIPGIPLLAAGWAVWGLCHSTIFN